jgi:nitric oxide reductase activation protein
VCLGGAFCGLALCGRARAQAPAPTDVPPPPAMSAGEPQGRANPSNVHGAQEPDPTAHGIEEHMAERRNSERQKTLVADTDKLLALAQQLKADVDKTDKDVLSIDVVKRAEQIEKLARSVKEKMRGN